jgi:hypothetical protein
MVTLAEEVRRLAVTLAESGRHVDCLTIEAELAGDGYPEAYVVLSEPHFRARLKAICDGHWHPAEPPSA